MNIRMCKKTLAAGLSTAAMIGLATNLTSTLAEEPQEQQYKVIVVGEQQEGQADKEEKQVRVRVQVDDEKKQDAPKLWLGILLKAVEGDLARYLGSDVGVLVDSVYDGSPAEKAGVQEGDLLLEANDQELKTPSILLKILGGIEEGEKIELELLRRGESMEVEVQPSARPDMTEIELVADVEGEDIEIEGLDGMDESIRKALKMIRSRNEGEDLKVFSLGGPAFGWRDIGNSKNIDIQIIREIDGEEVEIAVVRKDEAPAKITVTRDGETKELSEKDLDELPDQIAELVKKHLQPVVKGQRIEVGVELIPQLEALNLNEKELAERAREMATKYRRAAERAAAEAEVIRSRIKSRTEGGEEVAKLKAMVEELKAEVAELREKLSDR